MQTKFLLTPNALRPIIRINRNVLLRQIAPPNLRLPLSPLKDNFKFNLPLMLHIIHLLPKPTLLHILTKLFFLFSVHLEGTVFEDFNTSECHA